jgi:hypothetical protein
MQNDITPGDEQQRRRASGHSLRTSSDRVRDILAIVTVVGFIAITAILAIIFPLFALAPPDVMIQYLKDVSLIYSGIVGLIIGFYFGKP